MALADAPTQVLTRRVDRRFPPASAGRRAFYLMAVQHGVFAVVPVIVMVAAIVWSHRHHVLGIDFHRQYWVAGNRVGHGLSPFDPGWQHLREGIGFPYSALDALLFAPLGALPQGVATGLFVAVDIGAMLAVLYVLGVRDWRLFGLVMLWPPVFSAWQTGNVTALLALGIAVLWRLRDHRLAAGALMALLVTVKLFVWPVGLWLLATRRYAQLGWALAVGVVLNAGSWAIVGVDQFARYRELIAEVAGINESRSYSVAALCLTHGASRTVAFSLGLGAAAAVMIACVRAGRRGLDQQALVLSVAAALVAAPVIWLHYFALLTIPLALARPRLTPIWALPLVTVVCHVTSPSTTELLLMLAILAVVTATAVRPVAGFPRIWARYGDRPRLLASDA